MATQEERQGLVIPAQAGIQGVEIARAARSSMRELWIPTFRGNDGGFSPGTAVRLRGDDEEGDDMFGHRRRHQ